MRHVWLALVVVVLSVANARAMPASSDGSAHPGPERIEAETAGGTKVANGVMPDPDGALAPAADLEPHRPTRCGMYIVVYGFFYGLFLLCWAAFLAGRAALVDRYPAEAISKLVAEAVTTRQLRWYALWAAMQVVGVIGLSAAGSDGSAFVLAPFAFASLVRLVLARRVRHLLERPGTTAVRHGRWLVVTSPVGDAKLWASNQDYVQAARAGIPRSIAR